MYKRQVKSGRSAVSQKDLLEAVEVVLVGKEKKDRILSAQERRIVSYHEVGHALVSALQKDAEPVQKITIVPRTMGALGYVMQVPEEEKYLNTKKELEAMLVGYLGGRAAEELVFDDITTGASQDIKQATKMARDMVTRYGMSENIGLICYKDDDDEVFIGRDLAHAHSYSEGIASAIDVEVKRIIDESYEKAKTIIAEHRDVLDRCAALLLEKEKITREEFEALFEA